jgi:hypothetical protein
MKDIIDYYEDGGPADATRAESAEMERQAKSWMEKLQKEFYDEANPLGRMAMYIIYIIIINIILLYIVLKKKFPNDYPIKRFVGSWFRRRSSGPWPSCLLTSVGVWSYENTDLSTHTQRNSSAPLCDTPRGVSQSAQ